ncbi:hypothetical protein [Winogradskyella bathintestinalis]|uniref:Uncharacterized protein n=1 Tax=Winogradskyella bathintestinalis TaxID=3035208 RepID=A0ABT7ZYV4_9FLAO|nr:hypothetical protein [Winogradskyella bathintestinalis]MDN3494190.1 hypothetical protein [Winogradskyella bathintestinalis]
MSTNLEDFLAFIEPEPAETDTRSEKETEQFNKNTDYSKTTYKSLKNKRYRSNTNLRIYLAIWATLIVSAWLWKVGEILVNNNEKYCLSESVLNTLLTTTTIEVLGIVAIAMYDLFNGKSEESLKEE